MMYGCIMSEELKSGAVISTSVFARRREDVKWLIAEGGHVYLSINGRPRMKLAAIPPDELAALNAGGASPDRVEQTNTTPPSGTDVPTSVDDDPAVAG